MTVDFQEQAREFAAFLMADRSKGQRKSKDNGNKVEGRCPLPEHEDKSGSFGYFIDGDGWVCSCGSGKGSELRSRLGWACGACGANGHETAPPRPNVKALAPMPMDAPKDRQPDATHLYANNNRKLRFRNADGSKFCVWQHEQDGAWVKGQRGDPGLYNAKCLATAGDMACLTESESDVDALVALGFDAVSGANGANSPISHLQADAFKGLKVAIFEHQDEPGRKFAETSLESLTLADAEPFIVRVPAPHKDVRDFITAGADAFKILELAGRTWETVIGANLAAFSDARALCMEADVPTDFVAWPLAAKECLSILQGKPKGGKSCFALWLALCVAHGRCPQSRIDIPKKRTVLFMSWEDNAKRIKRRIREYSPRVAPGEPIPDNLIMQRSIPLDYWLNTKKGEIALRMAIRAAGAEFVVLDTLSYLHTVDENKAHDMKPVMAAARRICTELGVSILIIHHVRKSGQGGEAGEITDIGRGSGAINAAADMLINWGNQKDNVTSVTLASKETDSDKFLVHYDPQDDGTVNWNLLDEGAIETRKPKEMTEIIRKLALDHFKTHEIAGASKSTLGSKWKKSPTTVSYHMEILLTEPNSRFEAVEGSRNARLYRLKRPVSNLEMTGRDGS